MMLRFKAGIIAGLLILGPMAAVQAASPAPVVDLTTQPRQDTRTIPQAPGQVEQPRLSLDQRMDKLERQVDSRALLDMLQRIEMLTQEVQQLRGVAEEQTHTIEGLKQRQRDLYLDVDRRLSNVERGGSPMAPASSSMPPAIPPAVPSMSLQTPADPASAPPPVQQTATPAQQTSAQAALNPMREQEDYQKAFNVLKEGRYDQAITDFSAFLKAYPTGAFTDNAQYWLGEAYYVTRRFDDAVREFVKVSNNAESRKRSDAMLKLGYTYYEQQKWAESRKMLEQVVAQYPGSTVSRLAEKRLQDLRAAGR